MLISSIRNTEWANKIAGIGLRLYDLSPFLYLFFRRLKPAARSGQTKQESSLKEVTAGCMQSAGRRQEESDNNMKSSNIGGQAVLEGIMMKHKDEYAVAVRKPDGEILVNRDTYKSIVHRWKKLTEIPFIRGVFNFIDSMVLGMKTLTYSASFFEEEEEEGELTEKDAQKQEKKESLLMGATVAFSIVMAVAIFMVLPYFLSSLLEKYIPSYGVRTVIEGFVRIGIFIAYVLLISRMEDIQRTFMYHGAEHKCINCIEHGLPLTVENVRISSRQHKRCGTSFLFLVLAISIIMLVLVRAETPAMRIVIRIALLPVIAGISYEFLKLAGRSENPVVNLFSKPGLAIQKLTTKEPDDGMIEVAIQAVEAVFDWREYEEENFHTAADHERRDGELRGGRD